MRGDDLLRQYQRNSRRPADLLPINRMKKALDKAQRESSKVFVEEETPEIPKGLQESNDKNEADTPLRMPARDPLKILAH